MKKKSSKQEALEAEAISIFREVVATSTNPVMLYSMGKDSSVLLHLAYKAFYPAPIPFPILHVDTNWKFRDMYKFRDEITKKYDINLIVYKNPDAVAQNINPFEHGANHTDIWKTEGLKQALNKYGFDAAIGGARRDEEKSRAKERIFSFRDKKHKWDPKNQRPELWDIFNTKKNNGESFRVFPLSNWTELDIWEYISDQKIPIVPLYFAKTRNTVIRDGMIYMLDDDRFPIEKNEIPKLRKIRFRTLGCYPLTCAVESDAVDLNAIIEEIKTIKTSERNGRKIDSDQDSSMEKKKRDGYF